MGRPSRPGRLSTWLIIAVAGAVLLTIGLLGDWIIPARHAGFGWRQGWGAILGGIVALFGILVGADLLALAGAFLFGGSLTADWFGLTQGQGIGLKQQYVIVAGVACLMIAMWLRAGTLRSRKRQSRGDKPQPALTSAQSFGAKIYSVCRSWFC